MQTQNTVENTTLTTPNESKNEEWKGIGKTARKLTPEEATEIFIGYYKDLESVKYFSTKFNVPRYIINSIVGRKTFTKETQPFIHFILNRQKQIILDAENEIWKDIEHFEDQYQISNYGRVKSLERIDTKGQIRYQKLLRPSYNRGYLRVSLCQDAKPHYFSIHRLVGMHFLELPENYKELTINHKDGNKENNHTTNLEWVTQTDNNKHAYRTGLKNNKGENHGEAKLTNKQVLSIRYLDKIKWFNQQELAYIFKVSKTLIGKIINRESWTHI